jgi:hypothetical protein
VKELGVITLKGFVEPERGRDDSAGIKYIMFICPNPDCEQNKTDIKHLMHIPITSGDASKLSQERQSAVWHYEKVDEKHISVSPSILCPGDFHCGIPTNFELVNSRSDLYV